MVDELINSKNEKRNWQKNLLLILSFISVEVLAFLSFTLANSIILYTIFGLILVIGVIIASIKEIKSNEMSTYAFYLFPFILFSFLLMFTPLSNPLVPSHISAIDCYMFPFAFVSFSLLGFLLNKNKSIKLKHVFIGIYGALAVFTLLGFIYSMIQFEPFYTIKYQNAYVFYDGKPAPVTIGNTAYALMGFGMKEVKLTYFSMFPTLLSTSIIGLFFINPKEETKIFVLYCLFAFLGLITLIFTPTKFTIITDIFLIIISALVILFGRLKFKTKLFVKITKIISALAVIYLLVFIILSQSEISALNGIRNTLYSLPLIGKLFSLGRYRVIIDGIFSMNKLFGFFDMSISFSNSMLFDGFYLGGLIGGVLLIVSGFIFIYILYYFYSKHDNLLEKSLLIAFVLVYFAYNLINDTIQPYVYYDNYLLSYHNGPFLVVMFLVGYALYYFVDKKKKESVNTAVSNSVSSGTIEIKEENKDE